MNTGTIVVLLIVIAIIALIIRGIARDRREGRTSCDCGCGSCGLRDSCQSKKKSAKLQE